MISGIHSATVVVSDQEAALDFYVNILGWEKAIDAQVDENMRFVTVVPPGARTQLALWPEDAGDSGGTLGGIAGISLATQDIDATYKTLTERGVKFKEPVSTMPWGGKAAWFSDPDGNEFFLVEE